MWSRPDLYNDFVRENLQCVLCRKPALPDGIMCPRHKKKPNRKVELKQMIYHLSCHHNRMNRNEGLLLRHLTGQQCKERHCSNEIPRNPDLSFLLKTDSYQFLVDNCFYWPNATSTTGKGDMTFISRNTTLLLKKQTYRPMKVKPHNQRSERDKDSRLLPDRSRRTLYHLHPTVPPGPDPPKNKRWRYRNLTSLLKRHLTLSPRKRLLPQAFALRSKNTIIKQLWHCIQC